MKLKILVGLTDDCPTEEHVEVFAPGAYPLRATDPDDEYEYVDIPDEDALKEWACRYYDVHSIAEIHVSDELLATSLKTPQGTAAGRPVETVRIGPEGEAFPAPPPVPPVADKHDNEAETRLVRVTYAGGQCEWEARCVEPAVPGTAEVVCASEVGPLDALHQLKASLASMGLPCRPYVTNIERVALIFDD